MSFIQTYPSPNDEVAVFSLSQKEWHLKRARPSPTVSSHRFTCVYFPWTILQFAHFDRDTEKKKHGFVNFPRIGVFISTYRADA